ncbi:chemokine XC receptor 1-like [Odontesthes bonariensis]
MALGSDYNHDYYILHNDTEIDMVEPHVELAAFDIYETVCLTLIFCISMPGNSFLLWVLLREQAWRTTSGVLLLQLTLSNLCFTANMPFVASSALHGWIFGEWACGVMRGLCSLGFNSYLVILTAMTLNCYFTVVQPSCVSAQTSSKVIVLAASIVIWLGCAAMSINIAVKSRVVNFVGKETCSIAMESLIMLLVDINMEIYLFYVIPFIIMTLCYVHMWRTIKQGRINSYPQDSKLIFGITAGSFLCLAPHCILLFIESLVIVGAVEDRVVWSHEMHAVFLIFALFHFYCCLSPLFHIFGAQRFRRRLPLLCITSAQRGHGSNNDTSVQFMPLNDIAV